MTKTSRQQVFVNESKGLTLACMSLQREKDMPNRKQNKREFVSAGLVRMMMMWD